MAERSQHGVGGGGVKGVSPSGAHPHGEPDPELKLGGILWSAFGIIAVTAVAMVLMWWMTGGLRRHLVEQQPPPTPAERQRAEAVRRAGEEARAREEVPMPGLALPPELERPPAPRLELDPSFELERLREREERLLEEWGWADQEAGRVRIPIERAIELAAAGELPGMPASAPVTAGTDEPADEAGAVDGSAEAAPAAGASAEPGAAEEASGG